MSEHSDKEWAWREFRRHLQALALPHSTQAKAFPEFVVLGDELAMGFDEFYRVVASDRGAKLQPALSSLNCIQAQLDRMTALSDVDLWSHQGVLNRAEWEEIRRFAARALGELGWPLEDPGSFSDQYVGGAARPWWKLW
jgi:hypothetical protein